MGKAEAYKKNAETCEALAEQATSLPEKARYARMQKAWNELADAQAVLDGKPMQDSSDMRT